MLLSMVRSFWEEEHAFLQECNVNSRRYHMCSGVYNSYVRLFAFEFDRKKIYTHSKV